MGTGTIPPRDDARSAPPDPPTDDIPIVEISNRRRWIASLAVAVLVGGSAFDVLMAREDWPFSSYPMFWSVRSSELSALSLYGVTADGEEILFNDVRYTHPFDITKTRVSLGKIHKDPERRHQIDDALRDFLRRYETGRMVGRHDGPPLVGIRLYNVHWKLDPWARNAHQPDEGELIAEVLDGKVGI